MKNRKSKIENSPYFLVCKTEATFRVELLDLEDDILKEKAIDNMTHRLFNMYSDVFNSNHMNQIAKDVLECVTKKEEN